MPFSCGRTCVVVAVVVLLGFIVVALVCGRHQETFDAGANAAVDELHTVTETDHMNKTYAYIDENDHTVCYPNEVLKRHHESDPPCASYRIQNPAVYHDRIYMATTENPLKKIVFTNDLGPDGNPKTLKDVLLDPEVQYSINDVFERQKAMSNDIQTYYQQMKDVETEVKKQQQSIPTKSQGTAASPSVSLIPPPTPNISKVPEKTCASASGEDACQYKPYKYTNPQNISYPSPLPSIANVDVAIPPQGSFVC